MEWWVSVPLFQHFSMFVGDLYCSLWGEIKAWSCGPGFFTSSRAELSGRALQAVQQTPRKGLR